MLSNTDKHLDVLVKICEPFDLEFAGPDRYERYTVRFRATGENALHQVWFRDTSGGPAEVMRGYFSKRPKGPDPVDRTWVFRNHTYRLTKAGHVRLQDALTHGEFAQVFEALSP